MSYTTPFVLNLSSKTKCFHLFIYLFRFLGPKQSQRLNAAYQMSSLQYWYILKKLLMKTNLVLPPISRVISFHPLLLLCLTFTNNFWFKSSQINFCWVSEYCKHEVTSPHLHLHNVKRCKTSYLSAKCWLCPWI